MQRPWTLHFRPEFLGWNICTWGPSTEVLQDISVQGDWAPCAGTLNPHCSLESKQHSRACRERTLLPSFPADEVLRLPWWLRRWRMYLRCGRPGFDPWVGKTPWRRVWQPTGVFLPGESPWTAEPGGLQSMGSQRVGHDWVANTHSWEVGSIQSLPSQHKGRIWQSPEMGLQ